MACAWIAEKLIATGYAAGDQATLEYIARWSGVSPVEIGGGKSADYLRRSNQSDDLEFTLSHIDDLAVVPALVNGELIPASKKPRLQLAI